MTDTLSCANCYREVRALTSGLCPDCVVRQGVDPAALPEVSPALLREEIDRLGAELAAIRHQMRNDATVVQNAREAVRCMADERRIRVVYEREAKQWADRAHLAEEALARSIAPTMAPPAGHDVGMVWAGEPSDAGDTA